MPDCTAIGDYNCNGVGNFVLCNTRDFSNREDQCVYVPHAGEDNICHDVNDLDSCYNHIVWAIDVGRHNNPEWYPNFEEYAGASLTDADTLDMQMYFHCRTTAQDGRQGDCGAPVCGRECPERPTPTPPPSPETAGCDALEKRDC